MVSALPHRPPGPAVRGGMVITVPEIQNLSLTDGDLGCPQPSLPALQGESGAPASPTPALLVMSQWETSVLLGAFSYPLPRHHPDGCPCGHV